MREWMRRIARSYLRWDESTRLEWTKKLVEWNEFPDGMTGEQWARLRREILATIESK